MKNQDNQNSEYGVLETTAQAIGSTLGSLAVKTGIVKAQTNSAPAESPAGQSASNGNVVSMAGHKPGGKHARRSKKKK